MKFFPFWLFLTRQKSRLTGDALPGTLSYNMTVAILPLITIRTSKPSYSPGEFPVADNQNSLTAGQRGAAVAGCPPDKKNEDDIMTDDSKARKWAG